MNYYPLDTPELFTFIFSAIVLIWIWRLEKTFKMQEHPIWGTSWLVLYLSAWVSMVVCLLLVLFEVPNIRLGL